MMINNYDYSQSTSFFTEAKDAIKADIKSIDSNVNLLMLKPYSFSDFLMNIGFDFTKGGESNERRND